jgi:hypothetical protein
MLYIGCVSLFLFSVSLYLFSKSAQIRAKTRTEALYTYQLSKHIQSNLAGNGNEETLILEIANEKEIEQINHEVLKVTENVRLELEDNNILLETVKLDDTAIKFLQKVTEKKKAITQPEVFIQEELTWDITTEPIQKPWFNFNEVNLVMSERPENGLYYIAAKIMEKYDDFTALTSDGTGERMFEHKKIIEMNVGDVFIGQVEIFKRQWRLLHIWEINQVENVTHQNNVLEMVS